MNLEELINLIEFEDIVNKAIHCPTVEDSIACMELLASLSEDIRWAGDSRRPNTNDLKRGHGEKTCYRVDETEAIRFGTLDYYESAGYEIIELKDIIKTETKTEPEPILPKEERFKLLSKLL
jgi:hypothetical protein